MWEKLGGFATIVVAVAGLALIHAFEPPTFVQIVCAFAGSIVCLIGVVFCFSEGQILEHRRGKTAPKVG
jgi:zinc transporter ZupT